MTTSRELHFADWVAPIAARHRDVRAETEQLAATLSPEQLARETSDGWSIRDQFVHIATSEANVVSLLRAIARSEAPDLSVFADLDAKNARTLAEMQGYPMDALRSDLAARGLELQDALAKLGADDEATQYEGMPFPLGQLVAGYAGHEPYHLDQIRAVVGDKQKEAAT
jgi:uncharacterized damage-inducible protein DinB